MALQRSQITITLREEDSIFNKVVAGLLDDNYVNGLKFRELLNDLRNRLEEFIVKVFHNLQKYLKDKNCDHLGVEDFCRNNTARGFELPQTYDFQYWDTDVWCLILWFSPSMIKRPKKKIIDISALLEILRNFYGFKLFSHYAVSLYEYRNKFDGHRTESGIDRKQFEKAYKQYFYLLKRINKTTTINFHFNGEEWPLTIANYPGQPQSR